ncbi:PTS glucose transporter subunit IIA [Sebaldella sp. S0638]|uniref:PTS glucose transporter subunit IIA n=1 Tax=Sebaldella sp. S0638 TaxID=2957809 RepID=UPI00209F5DB6|nr:PTS glucose transporter subunit IIA [Sebaldella sp. S0638]MCP1226104.1 PTS glucose transporter subunit IIA [Sebaldella sp. S0638]
MGLFNLFKGKDDKKDFDGKIFAPLNGKIVPVEEVPDAVFAEKMVGDGIAIEPSGGDLILAPIDGKVEKIFDTNHAFSIVTDSGIELFVHFGIDTVQLEGKGFERLVEEGKTVKRGTPIIKYDYEFLKANAKTVITPVIISNIDEFAGLEKSSGDAIAGETKVLEVKFK